MSGLHRPTTGVCAEWAPKSSWLPVAVLAERVLDAALGCLILAIDALGVDPQQDFEAVTCPLGNLGSGDTAIELGGGCTVACRLDLLNLSDKPVTRMTREVWFEHTTGLLVIKPTPDSNRRLVIQRIHDTSNLAKFAFQISPPL